MIIGCDTGFFVEFIKGNPVTRQLSEAAARDEHQLVSSIICIYELKKLGLEGMVTKNAAFKVADNIPSLCTLVPLDDAALNLVEQAARLSHGNDLSMADALILGSVLTMNAQRLYTVDNDLAKYKGRLKVINLRGKI